MTTIEKPLTGAEDVVWDLSDLYSAPDDPQIERDLAEAKQKAEAFAQAYRGRVADLDVESLFEALQTLEDIDTIITKVGSFAFLAWTTDTASPTWGKLVARSQEAGTEIQQIILFFGLEWQKVPDDVAALADHPTLQRYGHYLKIERLYTPYTLSEPEEKIISQLNLSGAAGWNRYFGELISSIRFPWEGQEVTQSEILAKLYDSDRATRKQAADIVTEVLHKNSHATTFIFNMILLDKASKDKLRGFDTWIQSRNLSNQVDDATVEALIEAVTSRYDIVSRYYNVLKKQLGVDELFDYDRYAPTEASETRFHWDDARKIVLEAYGAFNPRMAEIAGYFFEKNWIHAPIQMGKRGGAYSASTSAKVHPYIFTNYEGNARSVETLAHELGHGVHQYLSREQGEFQSNTPLTTAEMASTFGEMLVFENLIAREDRPEARLSMRMEKVASTFATVFRQISMNRFEHAIHNARRDQGELSTAQISELWMASQRPMFGDSVTLRDEYSIWWSYVPHFLNTPGYVYAYSFGELLVWALYARYKKGQAGFAEGYLEVLSAGGSDWPHNILKPLGVDLQDPTFWHEGLGLLDDFVKEIEKDANSL